MVLLISYHQFPVKFPEISSLWQKHKYTPKKKKKKRKEKTRGPRYEDSKHIAWSLVQNYQAWSSFEDGPHLKPIILPGMWESVKVGLECIYVFINTPMTLVNFTLGTLIHKILLMATQSV